MISFKGVLRQIVRTPAKSLAMVVLLAAASTLFISRVCEYYVSSRELEKQLGFYEVYGTLEANSHRLGQYLETEKGGSEKEINSYGERSYWVNYAKTVPLTEEDFKIIAESEYVESFDRRKVSAGISDEFYTLPEPSLTSRYSYQASMHGTFGQDSVFVIMDTDENRVIKVVAGHPDLVNEGDIISINWHEGIYPFVEQYVELYNTNEVCFVALVAQSSFDKLFDINIYSPSAVYPFETDNIATILKETGFNLISEEDPYVMYGYIGGQTTAELIGVVQSNLRTFNMVYTKDTAMLPAAISGNMYIIEGEHITNDGCLISADLANRYGLGIGDKVGFRLRRSSSVHEGNVFGQVMTYIPAVESLPKMTRDESLWGRKLNYPEFTWTPKEFDSIPAKDAEFQVTGIYSYLKHSYTDENSYSLNTVFLPLSYYDDLTGGEESPDYPSTFTFKLKSPEVKDIFISKISEKLKQANLEIRFYDYGNDEIITGFRALIENTRLSLYISGAATVLMLLLIQFLFLSGKRNEYGVMRALGTPVHKANLFFIGVLSTFGAIALSAGGVVGLYVASGSMDKAFSKIGADQTVLDATVPTYIPIITVLLLLVALFVVSFLELYRTSKTSPLALLQTKTQTRQNARSIHEHTDALEQPPLQDLSVEGVYRYPVKSHIIIPVKKRPHISLIFSQVSKHLVRSKMRSIVAILAVSLLLVIVVQYKAELTQRQEQIEKVYQSADVVGYINSKSGATSVEIPYSIIEKIKNTKFVESFYAEAVHRLYYLNPSYSAGERKEMRLYSFNKVSGFEYADSVDITYADGYTESLFGGGERVCILDSTVMEAMNCDFGGTIRVAGFYTGHNAGEVGVELTVVGSFAPEEGHKLSSALEGSLFVPVKAMAEMSNEYYLGSMISSYCQVAEFKISNYELPELNSFSIYMEDLFNSRDTRISQLTFVMKDEEFRLVIEPLEKVTRIMLILLPFIIIVTSLIIGAISVYMVFQRSFEAALMRALGATKLHTVLRQSLEQMLLCLIGLIIGLLILQVYHKTQLMQFTDVILITFVLYFITTTLSSMFASGYAISQRVLELLQAKE